MIKKFNQMIDELINAHKKNNVPLDLLVLGIMRAVFLKKHQIDIETQEESLVIPDIVLKDAAIMQLINMEFSYFNEIGDDYLHPEHRSNTGSFYTPSEIVRFMVDDVFKNHLAQKPSYSEAFIRCFLKESECPVDEMEVELQRKAFLELLDHKVIDIASGSGLFLIGYLKRLKQLYGKLERTVVWRLDDWIEDHLFAVDIRPIPLQMLRYCLADMVLESKCSLNHTRDGVKCHNSIQGDSLLTMDGICDVLGQGGFDTVIGNPPYLGEKGNKALFESLRQSEFGRKYYEGKMDLFYFFVYRGMELLRPKGILSYITTNYFVTADGASKLRRFLKEEGAFKTLVNFNHQSVFQSMKGHNMIFTVLKAGGNRERINLIDYLDQKPLSKYRFEDLIEGDESDLFNQYSLNNQALLYSDSGQIRIYSNEIHYKIIDQLEKVPSVPLGNIAAVNQGIVSGADKVSKRMFTQKLNKETIERYKIEIGTPIFVLKSGVIQDVPEGMKFLLKPFYKNSDIGQYVVRESSDQYLLYLDSELQEPVLTLVEQWMSPYKEVLVQRREVQNGRRPWYALQWPRDPAIFEKEKLVVPQRAACNRFAWTNEPWYASADVYYITTGESTLDLKALLAYLNSKMVYYWLFHCGKKKGTNLELYATPLKSIPVPHVLYMKEHPVLIGLMNDIMETLRNHPDAVCTSKMDEVDDYLYKMLDLEQPWIDEIETFYNERVLSK